MNYKDLIAFKKAFELAMEIFHMSKRFPSEDKFGLTSQIRNSSRSVCASISEAYRKRRYEAFWINKLGDADMENSEVSVWLDFSLACGYIEESEKNRLESLSHEVGRLLNYMIHNPERFKTKSEKIT